MKKANEKYEKNELLIKRLEEIAKKISVSKATVSRWLKIHNIQATADDFKK